MLFDPSGTGNETARTWESCRKDFATMSDTRWQWVGIAVASTLVIFGLVLAVSAEHTPGYLVTLAGTSPSGSSTTLRFNASVSRADRIVPGDFFRIVDVAGYVDGSISAPPGWTATLESVSPAPPADPARVDDPAFPNLVFRYDGPGSIRGPILLKGFSARSTSGDPRAIRGFDARSTRVVGPEAGRSIVSRGDVRGPGAVPEPAGFISTTLGALLLAILAYAGRRHRRPRPLLA